MSLVCHECGEDIQPSDTLPRREGGMVHPNLISLAWFPDGEKWTSVFVEAPQGLACCLACIARGLSHSGRLAVLQAVGDAYNAEVALRRHEESMEGKWINLGGKEFERKLGLSDAWDEKQKLIPTNICLHCGNDATIGSKPYFTFKVMDRAYGEKNTSIFGSYQCSHIKTGNTHFSICFSCCNRHLPRIFKQMSDELRQTGRSNLGEVCKSEFFASSEFIDEFLGKFGNESVH